MAAAVNMGYENFRKIFFKETTGISPKRYHTEHLMRQAKMMLLSGLPIKHVAVSLGYGDIYSFTKQFTKSEGVSPGRYIRKTKPVQN
ncbi:helix-turn-helix domain-containing protein [Paenibacillus rhizoplanae]